jgi:hypothetical protein
MLDLVIIAIVVAAILGAVVRLNVSYRHHLASMTPLERAAHDDEMCRELWIW